MTVEPTNPVETTTTETEGPTTTTTTTGGNSETGLGDLTGHFRIFVPGSTLALQPVFVGTRSIEYYGCNSISIRYETAPNGIFRVSRPTISTFRFCSKNDDSKYADAILQSNSFRRDSVGIHLLRNGQRVATLLNGNTTLEKTSLETVRKFRLANGSIPEIDAVINGDSLRLSGCNNIVVNFEAFENGLFRISGPILTTRRTCQIDNDRDYIEALRSIDRYVRNAALLQLFDGDTLVAEIDSNCSA